MCAYQDYARSPRKILKAKFQLPTDFHLQFEWERNHFLFGLLQAVSFSKPHASHYYLATLTNSDKFESAMLSWRLWKGHIIMNSLSKKILLQWKILEHLSNFLWWWKWIRLVSCCSANLTVFVCLHYFLTKQKWVLK